MVRLYRALVAMALAVLVTASLPTSAFALDPDVSIPANGTGPNGATSHTLWYGDTSQYAAGEARFTWQVAPGATANFRWTCNGGATGPTQTAVGGADGVTVNVRGSTYSAAQVEFVTGGGGATYCAFAIWSTGGAFRVSNASVHFVWGDTSSPGTLPTPTPSPSPSPSPSGTPAPCTQGESTRVMENAGTEYTYRVITLCAETANYIDRAWTDGVGFADNFPLGRQWGNSWTVSSGETRMYVTERGTIAFNGSGGGHLIGPAPVGSAGVGNCFTNVPPGSPFGMDGTQRDWPGPCTITSGDSWRIIGDGDTGITVQGATTTLTIDLELLEVWLGPPWPVNAVHPRTGTDATPSPSPTPSPTPNTNDTDGDGYSDEVEAGAGTDPGDPNSYPGYQLPPGGNTGGGGGTGGDDWQYDGNDIDGGTPPAPGDDGTPGSSGGGSGIAECTTSDVTLKVGYQPYDDVPDTDDLAARLNGKDALDGLGTAIGWMGDMLWTLPNRIGNGIKWAVNTVVDFIIPGDCLTDIIEARMTDIQAEPPFSLFTEVNDLMSSSGAGSASLGSIPLPGGETIAFPMDALEDAAGVRPVLVGIVWLAAALAILSLIAGTFGVKGTGE